MADCICCLTPIANLLNVYSCPGCVPNGVDAAKVRAICGTCKKDNVGCFGRKTRVGGLDVLLCYFCAKKSSDNVALQVADRTVAGMAKHFPAVLAVYGWFGLLLQVSHTDMRDALKCTVFLEIFS